MKLLCIYKASATLSFGIKACITSLFSSPIILLANPRYIPNDPSLSLPTLSLTLRTFTPMKPPRNYMIIKLSKLLTLTMQLLNLSLKALS